MTEHIPDPAQPEKVAIRPDGGLAFGVRFGPARTDGPAPTVAELDRMAFLGWADAEQFTSTGENI